MLTDRQRYILAHQPVGRTKTSAGWTYVRFRLRAEEYASLMALANRLKAYPVVGRFPGAARISAVVRGIGRGWLGVHDPREQKIFATPELPERAQVTNRRFTERFPKEQNPKNA